MPPKQPTEAALINELQNQVNSWRGEQYNFAADLLQYFLSKQGGTMTPPMDDIIELKNDPKYRTRALGHFATKAEQMLDSGESGTYPIPTPNNFEIQYNPITDNPDLFYAFGNSHFSYNGTICLSAQARTWSVNVLMTQKDNYDFEAGPLNYRNESPTYYAGYLLEFKYGYPSFFDVETWNDYFDNTMEFPQE
jgi:hypothetical protein